MSHDLTDWEVDVLNVLNKLNNDFTLKEVYKYEVLLQEKHPNNFHVRDKIRQTLQYLRNKKYIIFLGRGKYQKVKW